MSLATPDADRAWVYALWAFLRIAIPAHGMQRTELLWEGVVYGERAVALAPSISYNLGALARCYRALYQELNGLYLLSKTADLYPQNQRYWIEDLIVSLTDYGYFKQALEQSDRPEPLEHPILFKSQARLSGAKLSALSSWCAWIKLRRLCS